MTNPGPHSSTGASGLPAFAHLSGTDTPMFRRTSYASVAAGTAPTSGSTVSQSQQPSRPSSVPRPTSTHPASHTSSGYTHPPSYHTDHSRHNSRGGVDADGAHYSGMSSSWGRAGQPPSYGSHFGSYGSGYSNHHTGISISDFFVPSYLRGSRHAERLEASHRARVSAQRDARSAHSSAPGSLSTSSSSVNLHKLVPSHRGMTHDIIERVPLFVDESTAPLPSCWNTADKFNGLDVQAEGLEVRFAGMGKAHDEAAAIRADHPMPRQCGIYYYEVTVVSKGKEGLIGIGFSGKNVALNRLPGWEPDSYAYHGDDGYSFCCTNNGKSYGPKYSTLDVIGCGVNFRTGSAFFTKNGVNLGVAFKDIKGDRLFPSVGMKKPGEHLRANFGQSPFVYDIVSLVEHEKLQIQQEILKAPVTSLHPPLNQSQLIHELIAQYLAHDGYVETARTFAEEVREESRALSNDTNTNVENLEIEEDVDAINRQKIRAFILEGDIDRALKHTQAYYPSVLQNNENIYFKLRCRKFIEMIRKCTEYQSGPIGSKNSKRASHNSNGYHSYDNEDEDEDVFDHQMELDDQLNGQSNGHKHTNGSSEQMETEDFGDKTANSMQMLQDTLQYGQVLRAEFAGDPRREVKRALEETFALLAYTDPRESLLAPLLETSGRVPVAEELNSAILVSLGKSSSAALERLCQQTEALVDELSEEGGAGAFINVRRDFLR